MIKLVLLRHGESIWNKDNLFTGWADVDLSEQGKIEAARAGELLKAEGFSFDVAFSSVLKRAIRTLWITLDVLDLMWIPVEHSWRLNERHYGALQGLNKAETAAKYGEEQVLIWRRSYDVPPPALAESDPQYPGRDPRYRGLVPSESRFQNASRTPLPAFSPTGTKQSYRRFKAARKQSLPHMATACGHWSNTSTIFPTKISCALNIPTGVPLVYELDDQLKPLRHYYLGDSDAIAKAMAAVANQGRAK